MNYETGICGNCGADNGLHEYETNRCPKNGIIETRFGINQQWQDTVFVDSGIKRLQDAAPELLEALQEMASRYWKYCDGTTEDTVIYAKAKAAIAKATGNNIKETV